jgi:hypothetical protein
MSLKISKKILVKLIKESKKMSIKESQDEGNIFTSLTPEQQRIVDIATSGTYRNNKSIEAQEILDQLWKQYDEVGYDGLSPEFKAIIEIQEDQKEEYKAMLNRDYEDYDQEGYLGKYNSSQEEWEKEQENQIERKKEKEENSKLDDLYQTQDDLAGIKTSHYHETVDRKLEEMFYTQREQGSPQHVLAQDEEGNEWHKKQEDETLQAQLKDPDIHKKMLSPEEAAAEEESAYYEDLINSLQDAESEHHNHLDRETDRILGR